MSTVAQRRHAFRLGDQESGPQAVWVSEAGMLGASLTHRGEELLWIGRGVAEYLRSGAFMGIPFLHPWANRLERCRYEAGDRPELLAAFPFPHRIEMEIAIVGSTLTVAAALLPTADEPVPVAFGFHPYLRIPGLPRAEWGILCARAVTPGRRRSARARAARARRTRRAAGRCRRRVRSRIGRSRR